MLRNSLGVVAAIAATLLLTGCPAAILVPLAASGAAGGAATGMLADRMTGDNPALSLHPELGDPELSAWQARLLEKHALLTPDPDGYFAINGARECALSEEAVWLIAKNQTPGQWAEMQETFIAQGMREEVSHIEANVLEGECRNGMPTGQITAVGRAESTTTGQGFSTHTVEHRRVYGTVVNGRFEGEQVASLYRISTTTLTASGYSNRAPTATHSIQTISDGDMIGRSLSVTAPLPEESRQTVYTTINTYLPGNRVQQLTYYGNMLASESTLVDWKLHGWHVRHPVQYLRSRFGGTSPESVERTCFQNNQEAPTSVCASAQ